MRTMEIVVGETYDVNGRAGAFRVKVKKIRGEWKDCVVVSGQARYMTREDAVVGDDVTLRERLYSWTLVDDA